MAVREFKLFNHSETTLLSNWLESAIAGWKNSWFGGSAIDTSFLLMSVDDMEISSCGNDCLIGHCDQIEECWAGLCLRNSITKVVTGTIAADMGDNDTIASQTQLTSHLGEEALFSLLEELAAYALNETQVRLTFAEELPGSESFYKGNGAVCVELTIADETAVLILSPGLVSRCLQRLPERVASEAQYVPMDASLGSQTVSLQAWVGAAELDIAELQDMAVGDVIRLDTEIEQPMSVTLGGDYTICYGHLGSNESHRALQLTAINEQSRG